jgi:hypothetical protein
MKTSLKIILVVMASFTLMMAVGCAKQVKTTGFLSDYSRLESTDDNLRYLDMKRLGQYKQFIIEPVFVRMYMKGEELDLNTRDGISNYMHKALTEAIADQYMIVSRSGPGVATLRVAITDIEKSNPVLNAIPQAKLIGTGLGGASMEGELLDSQTGEQIGALIESQKGSRLSLAGLKKWGDAKVVMDDWAKRFRKRLDEAHGNR